MIFSESEFQKLQLFIEYYIIQHFYSNTSFTQVYDHYSHFHSHFWNLFGQLVSSTITHQANEVELVSIYKKTLLDLHRSSSTYVFDCTHTDQDAKPMNCPQNERAKK